MRDAQYFSKLRGFLSNRRPRGAPRASTRRSSPFRLESLEARVLLSADLGGAIPVADMLKSSSVGTQQPAVITMANPVSTSASSSTLAATSALATAPAPTLYVAPTGSDSNNGRSIDTPFRTINKAGSVAGAGDVVDIRGGTYNEYVVLQNSGTSGSRITFMAHPGDRVVVDGSSKSPTPSNPWDTAPVIRVRGNYVTVQGIEVRNGAGDGVYVNGTNAILDNLHVHNTFLSGVQFYNTWDGLVQNSTIHDAYDYGGSSNGTHADGIGLKGDTGGRHTLRNNLIYNTSDDGIDSWKNGNNTIEGNIVHHAGRDNGNGNGFKLGPSGNNKVTRNVAYDNRAVGFDINSGGGNQFYNNTAYRNTGANFINYSLANTFRNNISYAGSVQLDSLAAQSANTWNLGITNPSFVSTDPASASFLRLANGSAAIDAGINVGLTYSGAAPDLGAYEVGGPAPSPAPAPAPAPAPSPTPSPSVEGAIKVSQATHEMGYAYYVGQNFGTPGDTNQALTISKLHIYENGKELGPAHVRHADIRQLGAGRFSHWGDGLYFSASDNSNPLTNGRTYTYRVDTGSTTPSPSPTPPPSSPYVEGAIRVAQATHNSGSAYFVAQDFGTPGDTMQALTVSKLKIYENGKELGPAHSWHADIRQQGAGRFSHWGNGLYFSAPDNSNPLTNGRTYTYRVYA